MSLRSSNRQRAAAFARKQKQYRIESDSDDDDDDDDETEKNESCNLRFGGGVLAILKSNKNVMRKQRKNGNGKSSAGKNRIMTSPPLKRASRDQGEEIADENGMTPPPKSVVMTRSKMRAISPLTALKPNLRPRRSKVVQDAYREENSRTDSFDDSFEDQDEDDETQHQNISHAEDKSVSLHSECSEEEEEEEESYEDSYDEASESSKEFEFGVDDVDEEFIPDEEDEGEGDEDEDEEDEDDESADFIVDDLSEDIFLESVSNDTSTTKRHDSDNDVDVDVDVDDTDNGYEDEDEGDNVLNCDDAGDTEIVIHERDNASTVNGDIDYDGDDTVELGDTPAKAELPRKTLDFSSPEPQMAMILDDDEDVFDDNDVLLATVIASDSVDGSTVVFTFDEDEENDVEDNEPTSIQEEEERPSIKESLSCNRKTKKSVVDYEEVKAQSLSSSANTQSLKLESSKGIKTENNKDYRQEGAVKRGKWALGAKIGVGSFGEVHVGMNTQTGVLMAVKKFRMEGAVMKDIRTEVELMRSFKHVNIVRYLGAQMDKEFLHIFQEWVSGGSVAGLLSKFGSFSIEVIQSYISQTLSGLRYLHDNNIMHRDIKGSNILVNNEGVVKLADFGASKKLKNLAADMMMSLTVRGTPYFMAPEVFEEKYSAKADIWGIGCVAFQMATAKPPWKELGFTNPISLFNHMKKQKGPPLMEHPQKESFSKQQEMSWNLFEQFVCRCFEYESSQRPSAKEIQDDPFFLTSVDGDADDDESTHFRGLFSPGNESKKLFSPKQFSSPAKQLSPARCLTRTKSKGRQDMTLMSPPLPKKNTERIESPFAKCDTPPTQPKVQNSPSPDTQEWPAWAKTELRKQNSCKEKISETKDATRNNLPELMDSLALSEDSRDPNQKTSTERRSSNFGSSTAYSSLIGVNFLESTRSDPST
uniref:Protein kinase domain-containing protein n=1 Tax=Pseudo-nitzschia australis TaxID=44445 RepID=A0A7S4AJ49_9STRA